MMRLIGVELTRVRWRRAVLLMMAAAVVIPIVVMAISLWDSRPVSDAEIRQAEEIAAREAERQRSDPMFQQDVERCQENPQEWGYPDAEACETEMLPRAEWYLTRTPLQPESVLRDQGAAVGIIGAVLMLLAGATYIGHDWASGSMSNQLLFEPRRLRVWGAKALAIGAYAAVVALLGQVLFWVGILLAARAWDIDMGTVTGRLDGLLLRSVVLVAFAAVFGFALTMLFRSTVATLGILFAVVVAGTIVLNVLPIADAQRWHPATNLLAWLQHGTEFYGGGEVVCTYDETTGAQECSGDGYRFLTLAGAARYLGALVAVAVALSIPSFLRRDVP